MLVLTLDTACAACSVAVANEKEVLAYVEEGQKHRQAEVLLQMVAEALSMAGASYHDLGLIALTNGPGSFTGIRIGLATAYGVHLAMGTKVMAISTLEAMAQDAKMAGQMLIALSAGRRQYYVQEFAADRKSIKEPALWDEATVLAYEGEIAGNFLLPGRSVQQLSPNARQVALYVMRNHAIALEAHLRELPQPLYIREHDAVKPKNGH